MSYYRISLMFMLVPHRSIALRLSPLEWGDYFMLKA